MDSQERDAAIKRMREELDALQQIKTAEDVDEGARLHALHNAPWKHGQYSHLEFPPYKFQAFPKMLYALDYPDATIARMEAENLPAIGVNDHDRKKALILAERRVAAATRIVHSEKELRAAGAGWYETPDEVVEAKAGFQRDMEMADAHRAYEDRNMGDLAKREMEAVEDASEAFVPVIAEQKRGPGRPRSNS